MQTFRDFLTWYNNKDVIGFVEALSKMIEFYKSKDLDMMKDGMSVPGLTLKYMFKTMQKDTFFTLIDKKNQDLHKTIKDNICGGPSLVFHRYLFISDIPNDLGLISHVFISEISSIVSYQVYINSGKMI